MSLPDEEKTLTGATPMPVGSDVRRAYLVVIASPGDTGRMFRLDGQEVVVGRAVEATIRIEDAGISRLHARLVMREDGAELIDLGSKNGTFVNGERVDAATLHDGDKFQLGTGTILKLSFQDPLDEQLQQNLYDAATRDALTRAYNKKFFVEAVEKEIAYCRRHHAPLCLVMLDVDHFKVVNDTHGHQAGDVVLAELAEILLGSIRSEDLHARMGGEEFAVLLRECNEVQGLQFGERVRARIEAHHFEWEGRGIPVTASLGVSELSDAMSTADDLIGAADRSLYAAKHAGRNRVQGTTSTGLPW